MMLNKFEKEDLVIKLLNEGMTIREIARETHTSFKDIGVISKKLRGETETVEMASPARSIETKALILFAQGKNQIDVAILLDISSKKVRTIYKEFLRLNRMHLVVWITIKSKTIASCF